MRVRQNVDPQPEPLNLVKKEKKIASIDYQAWDKYDPDTELMKLELEEEKIQREAREAQKVREKLNFDAVRFAQAGSSSQFFLGSVSNANLKKLKKSVRYFKSNVLKIMLFENNFRYRLINIRLKLRLHSYQIGNWKRVENFSKAGIMNWPFNVSPKAFCAKPRSPT